MAAHNTYRSISYQLTVNEDKWIVWCVMLLFRARLLTGHSAYLINPVVRMVQNRKRVAKASINEARKILREYHTADLVMLVSREENQ